MDGIIPSPALLRIEPLRIEPEARIFLIYHDTKQMIVPAGGTMTKGQLAAAALRV